MLRLTARSAVSSLLFLSVLSLAACGGGGGGGGGDSGGGGGAGGVPSTPVAVDHSGVLAAAAGDATVRLHLRRPPSGFESTLFHATSTAGLLAGTQVTVTADTVTVTSLTNGIERVFSLAIRPTGGSTWTLAGAAVRARPSATTIYVDAAAGAGGNGSLANPFNTLQAGLTAATGSTNVWVRDGSYTPGVVSPGTHVYGGFASGAFTLANRDPLAALTIVAAGASQSAIAMSVAGTRVIVDGFALRGNSAGLVGVDHENLNLELRSVSVSSFTDRGIRLRNPINTTSPQFTQNLDIQLVNVFSQQNGADGLNLVGPFDLRVDSCAFDANVQEGMEFGPLYAMDGLTSTVEVTHSRFANNGSEGCDASLDDVIQQPSGGGTFQLSFRGCTFSGNGLDGLLVDQEHDLTAWTSNATVRDCTASENALAGFHIDFDGRGAMLVHNVRATCNTTDGVLVTSETDAGHAVVSSSHLAGNLGAGLRVTSGTGNKIVLASHCTFAGNQQGGMLSPSRVSSATNCIFHLQPTPTSNVRELGNATITSAAAAAFTNAPNSYARVNANTNGSLTLAATATFSAGATVELADNGTSLTAPQVAGTSVVLSANPTLRRVPAGLMAYPSTSIVDDFALALGSTAIAAGMKELGAADVDAGTLGSPIGDTPGVSDPIPSALLWMDQVTPLPNATLGASDSVALRFTSSLTGGSVTGARMRVVSGTSTVVAASIGVVGNTVTLTPPGGGWPSGQLRIEIHRDIAAGSTTFTHPTIYPLR